MNFFTLKNFILVSFIFWLSTLGNGLFNAGFMSEDDLALASLGGSRDNAFQVSSQLAQQTGRFYQLFVGITTRVPYLLPVEYQIEFLGIARLLQVLFFFFTIIL
jgi:hypothetical protein